MKIVIVGGSAGGATCAARLRRLDEKAEIVVIERGEHVSYANCGLPYYVGGVIQEKRALLVQTPDALRNKYLLDIRTESEVVHIDRENKRVTVRSGSAEYTEKYDTLVLATGSTPLRPKIPGIDSKRIHTLWTVPDAAAVKEMADESKSAVVVGGGFIGMEVAENLLEKGLDVTIVDAADQILAPMDFEMAKVLEQQVRRKGAQLILSDGIQGFAETDGGIRVTLSSGKELSADMAVLSIGIRPNTAIAKEAGLTLSDRGFVEVDGHMRTNDPAIYACGDIARYDDIVLGDRTTVQLAGPANRQARIVADNIAGIPSVFRGTQGTSVALIFGLTAASTGANEKMLVRKGLKKGVDYESVILTQNNHPGYYPGVAQMIIKLIFSKDGEKVYGAQIVGGEGADKRLDVIAASMRLGATVRDLCELELAYSPVYSSPKDPVNMAGFVASNVLDGMVRFCDWRFDVPNAQILDVREDVERMAYSLPTAIPMPLGTVRQNLDKLKKDAPIVIFCAIGARAYTAARILSQNGFKDVYVYPGGLKVYRATHEEPEPPRAEKAPPAPKKSNAEPAKAIELNCSGLQCPGPLMKLYETMNGMRDGEMLRIRATDPGFPVDAEAWCRRTGNTFLGSVAEGSEYSVLVQKGKSASAPDIVEAEDANGKTIIVFSGDFDKVMASFIIANGAAAMGRKVTMFFTFWGLTALRRPEKVAVKKNFMEKMFAFMLPRGTNKLGLSRMNMLGMGSIMMKKIMKDKNVETLEGLMQKAKQNGVRLLACSMSMDVMGIHKEELIDGVQVVGVGTYLGSAEEANVNLFL
ncbi:MAG: FAD-dependent oxidoreductase [Christensenellales bacterium]|jgi:NADPH-dependent 2,4-dienoyl-CoA reductase/sulfur reductase-like enzyme/peroxiredoxin family protein/TusA-related sulfurtransferase/rhodanese-related sulfurtransferase